MATLTQTSIVSKKIFNTFAMIIGIAIITFIAYKYGNVVIRAIFPPPPPPATVAFSKIPKLDLSEGIKPAGQITYSLETISGELPGLPNKTKVFSVSDNESFFGALERTNKKVENIEFRSKAINLSGNIATYIDNSEGERNLIINIVNGNLKLDSNYKQDKEILNNKPNSYEDAIRNASEFLHVMEIDDIEFNNNKVETLSFKIEGDKIVEVPGLSLANIVQVNFFRNDIDKYLVISPVIRESWVKVFVGANRKIVAADIGRTNLKRYKFATYPLKSTKKAYEDLKAGKGAFNMNLNSNKVAIRDVVLGYLDTKKHNGYMQPVYIFKSDNGLLAYVAAVDEAWNSN